MIDTVHDSQKAYRNLISAYSFPGSLHQLLPEEFETGYGNTEPAALTVLAIMLLDAETCVWTAGLNPDWEPLIRQLTYAAEGSSRYR